MDKNSIIRYIVGTASEEEVIGIEKRLASESGFRKEVAAVKRELVQNPKTADDVLQSDITKVLQYKELNDLEQFFGGLQAKLVQELEGTKQTHSLEEAIQYSLQQLKEWFMPLSLYEKRIVGVSRGGSDALVAPQKNTNCHNRILEFRWKSMKKGEVEEIDLILENNRGKVLLEEALEVEAGSYTAVLTKELFTPGRYYWKFCVEDEEPIMGVFFVEKDKMP